ncbi:hypothetical protein [Corynebacterium sp.]|uniref:hypothetical protein n=1 Tax=Corynebacterium sp. TaxID=1720 RepID=UPI003B3A5324
MRPVLAIGVGAPLLLGGCLAVRGGESEDGPVVTDTRTVTNTVEMPAPTGKATVPGEEVETYFSTEGQEVGVAGWGPDREPLIVRDVPSVDGDDVAHVDRLGAVELAGREWNNTDLPDEGYWAEVRVDGAQGWMLSGHLFHFGGNADVTGDYVDMPAADEEQELVTSVGGQSAGDQAEWILLTTPDYAGEPFYRVDVTGMKDDAQAGERLFVTVEENDGRYAVGKVERTLLCHRGVSGGLCL